MSDTSSSTHTSTSSTQPGMHIGHYHLLQLIGEGGMGEVWLAEQTEPVRRRVALKVIKIGMDTREVVARFEAERQALALMDHPYVAKVFEAGSTPDGRPYFAMEHVPGVSITTHCDQHRLTTAERLALLGQVCEGVQHAHQKAIIHRDLKPSNILVSIQDGKAVPKIIDFGVAKATAQRLTERTLFTELGVLIGTPEYMSPEQADLTSQDIDTRTDVYSLGVVLYELLVGALPFDARELRQAGFEALRRKIREDDPPKPSLRLSTIGGDRSTQCARARRVDLPTLQREITGDLDWITMKALEKDRARRYGSPAELAADIVRHLCHEPVLAASPGAAYRVGKFVRRHRLGVAVATSAVILLATFAVAMTVQAARIARERDRANQEAAVARQVSDFLVESFKISDPSESRGSRVTAREVLDQGATRIERELTNQPLLQARLMSTMGQVYQSLGLYGQAGRLLEASLARRQQLLGTDDPAVAESLDQLGTLLWMRGDYRRADEVLWRALDQHRKTLGADHPDVATTLNTIGNLRYTQGDYPAAEAMKREALAIRRRSFQGDHVAVSDSLNDLATILGRQDKNAEAEPLYREALDMRRRLLGPDHPAVAQTVNNLGMLYYRRRDLVAAEPLLREALALNLRVYGEAHPEVTTSLNNVGLVLRDRGALDDAEQLLRRAVNRAAPADPQLDVVLVNYAAVLMRLKRPADAEAIYRRALAQRIEAYGTDNWQVASVQSQLGDCLASQRRFVEAEPLILGAYDRIQSVLGDSHPATQAALRRVPKLYDAWGKPEKVAEWRKRLPPEEGQQPVVR